MANNCIFGTKKVMVYYRYFEDDDDEEQPPAVDGDLEYQPAPDSPGRSGAKDSDESDADSVDPLDAFMAGIDVSAIHSTSVAFFWDFFFVW